MVDFRKWVVALFVLTLFAGLASAQISGSQSTPLTCSLGGATGAVTPQIRSESRADAVGDIVITCAGGGILTDGSDIPQTNIVVTMNTAITSRLFSATTGASEALLLIDEPGANLTPVVTGFGSDAVQTLCTDPARGCKAKVASQPLIDGSGNVGVAADPGNPDTSAANVYQGIVNGSTVTFFGVPILPPATTNFQRVYRITNLRINAPGVSGGSFGVVQVYASISTNGNTSLPLSNPSLVVGFVQQSLSVDATAVSKLPSYLQCTDASISTVASVLSYKELFATAFKTRVVPLTTAALAGQVTNETPVTNSRVQSAQAIPGGVYGGNQLLNSESDFIFPIGSNWAGLADFGTRLKAVFTNIPAGTSLWVSTTNTDATGNTAAAQSLTAGGQDVNAFAVLVGSDETAPEVTSLAAPTGAKTAGSAAKAVKLTAAADGSYTAVWEVINADPNFLDTMNFGVYISYTADTANGKPTAPSAGYVVESYAPLSNVVGGSTSALIPRFVNLDTTARQFVAINICQTALLWPYVVTGASSGFDTGLAVANTSTSPTRLSGTTLAQTGSCNLYWYGQNYGAAGATTATTTPITYGCDQTDAVSTACVGIGTTKVIASGQVWASTASALQTVPSGSTWVGYVIGLCNFQYAHGYAAITDIGVRNFVSSYLALVMQNSDSGQLYRGVVGEALNQ